MNVQVLGARGMLGQAVVRAFTESAHRVVNGPPVDLEHALLSGDVVVNCAGVVKQRNETPARLIRVNAYAPHVLAATCDGLGIRLIQVSTDCVFSDHGPHNESDTPSPTDLYGVSKLAGEVTHAPHLTIRTSFVGFGKYGLIADLQKEQRVVAGRGLLWSGHTVPEIARLIVWLAERPEIHGLLHIPGEYQTRYQLATRLKERYNLPATIEPADDWYIDRRLTSSKVWLSGFTFRSFTKQLAELEPGT